MKFRLPRFKKNYKSMIGVTVLAFLLWFMVKMNSTYQYTYDIPIQFVNLDPERVFKKPFDAQVRIEFSGKGIDLLRMNFYKVIYQIDLSGVPEKSAFDLSKHPEYVNMPGELEVTVKSVLRPRNIALEFDQKVTKRIPVAVDYELSEPAGFILVSISVQPDSIQLTGPSEMFKNIRQITTEKMSFVEPDKAFSEVIKIQQLKDYFAEYEPKEVLVNFNIQRLAEKSIREVPVSIVNKPSSLQVIPLPSSANIYVKGGEKILADLDLDDFEILIDFRKNWRPGVQKVKADLKTEANIIYMETRPPLFELIVQKKTAK
jgi:YbbR domain-containing protein